MGNVYVEYPSKEDKSVGLTALAVDIRVGKTALIDGEIVVGTNNIPESVQLEGSITGVFNGYDGSSISTSLPQPGAPLRSMSISFIGVTPALGDVVGGGLCLAGETVNVTVYYDNSYKGITISLSADGSTITRGNRAYGSYSARGTTKGTIKITGNYA